MNTSSTSTGTNDSTSDSPSGRSGGTGGTHRDVDVLVVGAGPAGLAAAARLAALGAGRVEILEREREPGGVPRHCFHRGFGTGAESVDGPAYAGRWTAAAERAGARLRTGVTALGWTGPLTLATTGPDGPAEVSARAVVLATGARERPRAARLVPGTRPAGVFTTGELQQSVYLYRQDVGRRAVVVGAEQVSYHAMDTLRRAGVAPVAMVTEYERHQASPAHATAARLRYGVPLLTRTTVTALVGHGRLAGVRLRHSDGRTTTLACDTVVFTGDFVPEHELARDGGLVLDPGTLGPAVDMSFRTTRDGVFAVGSLLHAAEPAGTAAREGVLAAVPVLAHLAAVPGTPRAAPVPVRVDAPLRWIAPNLLATATARQPFVLRTARFLDRPVLQVAQGGRVLHHERLRGTAVPNRTVRMSAAWVRDVDPDGGPVRVTVLGPTGGTPPPTEPPAADGGTDAS
ncbi:NAD(P)/FAD-dependent oxidoreductase [Streptomyces uncialis]|uniref:NAD(P)/FAD-dependent oxidoreductase n=1 Tax=Streptomyces uncialis TaxID=1048205 RepID=UPI0038671C92|nr:FAD-dependent oxidoreductase [Streptomyces uncialis]